MNMPYSSKMPPNKHVNLTAQQRCCWVPSVLRTPAEGYVRRRASRYPYAICKCPGASLSAPVHG